MQDQIAAGNLKIACVKTGDNVADVLTKAMGRLPLWKHMANMGYEIVSYVVTDVSYFFANTSACSRLDPSRDAPCRLVACNALVPARDASQSFRRACPTT